MNRDETIQKIILLDFNCSSEYTHHWSSLIAYGSFLSKHKKLTEAWLPRTTAPTIVSRIPIGIRVRKILKSPQYSRVTLKSDPLGFFAQKLVRIFSPTDNRKIWDVFRRIFVLLYIAPTYNKIQKEIARQEITLVFPTLDFLGLQLIKLLLNKYPSQHICVRRMGSEEKHPLAKGGEFESLLELIGSNRFINLKLGIPTETLFEKIRETSSHPEKIFWSPLPPEERSIKVLKQTHDGIVNIGFPGTVKERKGYDRIPDIVALLISEDVNFKIYVQTALFSWKSYPESRDRLIKTAGDRLVELEPVLSVPRYMELFAKYDLIILPYDRNSYADADSGVLYEASDFGIPVACFDNLGFSDEAFKHGIGINLEKVTSFKKLLHEIKSENMLSNFRNYNALREQAIIQFLSLSEKNKI